MKKKILFCPYCALEREVVHCAQNVQVKVKNEIVEVPEELFQCKACDHLLRDPDNYIDVSDLALREFRRVHNMLMPEEIKGIRQKLNLTQQEFASLLEVSHVTISRYETGDLQDNVYDNLLNLISDPYTLSKHIEKKRSNIPSEVILKVEEYLSQCKKPNIPKNSELKNKPQMAELQFSIHEESRSDWMNENNDLSKWRHRKDQHLKLNMTNWGISKVSKKIRGK